MLRRSFLLLVFSLWMGVPVLANVWSSGGRMTHIRTLHTATLLPDGRVLAAGGTDGANTFNIVEIYDPKAGMWVSPPGSGPWMNHSRKNHTATLLTSGQVLIVGGENNSNALSSAEIFNPKKNTWTLVGSLHKGRSLHTATLLDSGKVLVVGGRTSSGTAEASFEIYDPATKTWSLVEHPDLGRWGHTATLLSSRKVLVMGGQGSAFDGDSLDSQKTALIYDPVNGTWTRSPTTVSRRHNHTATQLPNGKVLVAGGYNSEGRLLSDAQMYDPVSNSWSPFGNLGSGRASHSATLLRGRILLVGGVDFSTTTTFFTFPEWTSGPPAPAISPAGHTATLLPNGKVLVAGNGNSLLYCEYGGTWLSESSLKSPRGHHTATLLPSGEVLVVGGKSGASVLATAEIYNPATSSWKDAPPLALGRWGHTATLLPGGKVLVVGGCQGACTQANEILNDIQLYDPISRIWMPGGQLKVARAHHTATLLASGKVLITGGFGLSGISSSNLPGALGSLEIYDPRTKQSQLSVGSLAVPRFSHTATLLDPGKVLVVGGKSGSPLESVEIFDPLTERSRLTRELWHARAGHTATLLHSGHVLVTGGEGESGTVNNTSEVFSTASERWHQDLLDTPLAGHATVLLFSGEVLAVGGATQTSGGKAELYFAAFENWLPAGSPPSPIPQGSTATLLLSGKVLVAGGSTQIYSPTTQSMTGRRQPVIESAPATSFGGPLTIKAPTGSGFRGDSDTGGGTGSSSAADHPIAQLTAVEGGRLTLLMGEGLTRFDAPELKAEPRVSFSSVTPSEGIRLYPGWNLLTVTSSGVASEAKMVQIDCGLLITKYPESKEVRLGSSATFEVEIAVGPNAYQWQVLTLLGWEEIPGATKPTYTTSAVTDPKTSARYRVAVRNVCMDWVSQEVTLTVKDEQKPQVQVLSPQGGDYWLLGGEGLIAWAMSDNERICKVELSLLFSKDGGRSWLPGASVPPFGSGPGCPAPGESTTIFRYPVPAAPPSGAPGSLYKVQVRVTDFAGNSTTAESPKPFYIVNPNLDSVKTLILANLPRMQAQMGIAPEKIAELSDRLQELAAHPRVQGAVIELNIAPTLASLYNAWDADPANPQRANDVLFAPGGLHEYLLKTLLPVYTGAEYLVLVGDDRILPMARVGDGTTLLPESTYTGGENLTSNGALGQALSQDFFLSDDPLAVRRAVRLEDLATGKRLFLPDLAVGRLVENPEDIIKTIAAYISQDGVLDLSVLGSSGNKVLVTGYDFLEDSARKIGGLWKARLGQPVNGATSAPVNDQLVGTTWGASSPLERSDDLWKHLGGSGPRYGISILNGHATHHQEGVPGDDWNDVEGLSAIDIHGPDACSATSKGALDLAGGVVFAVGCHGGLPVPGSCSTDADNSLDLPQSFLSRGVLTYVANTGYGWGLRYGLGYAERLMEILNEDLTAGGVIVTGKAVRDAKLRYSLESFRRDAYDRKTMMQWTLFGLPMYAVRTGISSQAAAASWKQAAPQARPEVERFGAVTVKRRLFGAEDGTAPDEKMEKASLPPFLVRLDLGFNLNAAGVYRKYTAAGARVEGSIGCPSSDGCYYTLNGLVERALGATDLPLEPYFVYDTRLSGTSQHGVLWKGGTYEQESGWIPVIGELVSNGADSSNHGSIPTTTLPPTIIEQTKDPIGGVCPASDFATSSLIVPTGEAVKPAGSETSSIHRLHRSVDLEVFYFNNLFDAGENCDWQGPEIGAGPYHEYQPLTRTLRFTVPASDTAGVWRVLVVSTDGSLDAQGRGRWIPLELSPESGDDWTGSLTLPATSQRLTYFIQAVDNRGNVGWLDYVPAMLPASGVDPGLPQPVEITEDEIKAFGAGVSASLQDRVRRHTEDALQRRSSGRR